jgi:glycosyltransferase involved in cell wall biosynthesis
VDTRRNDFAVNGLERKLHKDFNRHAFRVGQPSLEDYHRELYNAKSVSSADPTKSMYLSYTPQFLDLQYANRVIECDRPLQHEELVTIIIPSYNNEAFITRAVHSALSQQGVRIELLVVDDGSTDGSVGVASKIAAAVPNMRVISLLRNFGCYYARNVGVLNAHGVYVTIIDSDDIMAPDRILRQLDALKENPSALACRCHQRRWLADYSQPIGELKPGESSLLWKCDLIESIGWYDTVRYSGDAEFRLRIQRTFGLKSVVVMPDELYFARMLDNSLTTSKDSKVFAIKNNVLTDARSPQRKKYATNFTHWQRANKPSVLGEKGSMYVEFPLRSRPFDLGADSQNASASLGQRCIGAMATFPPRHESLKATIASILPQLDQLILYLNAYDDIPEVARHPKIRVICGDKALGDLRDNGKFFDLPQDDNTYIFTLDDDLLYPPDYVARMIHFIEVLGRSSVVGVHGVIFPKENFTQLSQRETFHFSRGCLGHFVDLLGTGTVAWHSSTLKLSLSDFGTKGVCDLWFAVAAAKNMVPLFCIPRERGWVNICERFAENLYQEALLQPEGYFHIYTQFLEPVLKRDLIRIRMEAHLARGFYAEALIAAGIYLRDVRPDRLSQAIPVRLGNVFQSLPVMTNVIVTEAPLHFHIVVSGWNCCDYVDDCLRSIAKDTLIYSPNIGHNTVIPY